MKRLEERRRVRLFAELGSTMKLPRSGRGRLSLEVQELADHERPPMIRIPEYLEKRRLAAGGGERRRAGRLSADARTRAPAAPADRARLVQGLPHERRGGAGDRRRVAPGAPGRRRPARAARRRRRGDAGRDRGSGRLGPARGRGARPARPAGPGPRGWRGTTARAAFVEMATASGLSLVAPAERDAVSATTARDRRPPARRAGRRDPGHRAGDRRVAPRRTAAPACSGRWARPSPTTSRRWTWPAWTRGLREVRLRIACDVTNPLLGPDGAAAVYGPQKGATPGAGRGAGCASRPVRRRAGGRDRPPRARHPGRRRRGRRSGFGLLCLRGLVRVAAPGAGDRPRHGGGRLRRGARDGGPRDHGRGPDRRTRPPSARRRWAWRGGRGRPGSRASRSAAA